MGHLVLHDTDLITKNSSLWSYHYILPYDVLSKAYLKLIDSLIYDETPFIAQKNDGSWICGEYITKGLTERQFQCTSSMQQIKKKTHL